MNQLENLQLTEEDFTLINQGLDELPNKDRIGEAFADIFIGSLGDKNPELMRKHEMERLKNKKEREAEKILQMENIRILQGKLIQFKRFLKEKGLLQEVEEILNKE